MLDHSFWVAILWLLSEMHLASTALLESLVQIWRVNWMTGFASSCWLIESTHLGGPEICKLRNKIKALKKGRGMKRPDYFSEFFN